MAEKEKNDGSSTTLAQSKAILKMMTTDEFKKEFSTILRAKYPLFYVSVAEEPRFITFLEHFCKVNGYKCSIWDTFNGLIDINSKEKTGGASEDMKDPGAILNHILSSGKNYENKKESVDKKREEGCRGEIFVLLDFHRFLDNDVAPELERMLRAVAGLNGIVSTILTGPFYTSSSAVENLIPNIDFPFANKEEIKTALYEVVEGVKSSPKLVGIEKETKKREEDLINAVTGLTLSEAQTGFSKCLITHNEWNLKSIIAEKKQIINKNGMLEYYDPDVSMDDVGGLKNLVNWIRDRKVCFSQEAEKYGLKKPRGLLILGNSGAGKSLVCKAISSVWNMPLLRLDFGKLFGSLVGDSEKNTRSAIKMAELVSPSILWLDEIEKSISGVKSSSQTDGGTTNRVLSTFLTWMQEKVAPVFVVATANDHEAMPPEFLRAGRFDEIFYVALPNEEERMEIFAIHLKKHNLKPKTFSLGLLSKESDQYSGAEIEKAIDIALLTGFLDGKRKIKDDDIVNALGEFKPLSVLKAEDFDNLKQWAEDTGCRKANAEPKTKVNFGMTGAKDIDLE